MAPDAQFRSVLDSIIMFIELSPCPNLFSLLAVVTNVLVIQIQVLLQNELLALVYELNHDGPVGILDIENNSLVPNWRCTESKICLSERVVLNHFHLMLTVLEILRIHNVHLQLRVAANAHRGHELSLGLHRLLQFEFDFFLLAMVVDNVAHDLLLALLQLVLRLDVLDDEFLDGDGSVFVDIDLIEDLVNDFVAHLVIQNLLDHTRQTKTQISIHTVCFETRHLKPQVVKS